MVDVPGFDARASEDRGTREPTVIVLALLFFGLALTWNFFCFREGGDFGFSMRVFEVYNGGQIPDATTLETASPIVQEAFEQSTASVMLLLIAGFTLFGSRRIARRALDRKNMSLTVAYGWGVAGLVLPVVSWIAFIFAKGRDESMRVAMNSKTLFRTHTFLAVVSFFVGSSLIEALIDASDTEAEFLASADTAEMVYLGLGALLIVGFAMFQVLRMRPGPTVGSAAQYMPPPPPIAGPTPLAPPVASTMPPPPPPMAPPAPPLAPPVDTGDTTPSDNGSATR